MIRSNLIHSVALIVLLSLMLPGTKSWGEAGYKQWEAIGPAGATVFSMARDPFSSTTLYVGNYFGGLHRSDNFGVTWSHIPSPFSQLTVMQVALSSQQQGRIAVATFQGGAFTSADGTHWEAINQGLPTLTLQDIAFDPFNAQRMLAATISGLALSSNQGQSWVTTTVPLLTSGKSIAYDRWTQNRIFLGTLDQGVYRSTNGGVNWTAFNAGLGNLIINHLDFETNGNNLYASTAKGVFRLAKNGTVWQNVTYNLPDTAVQQVYDQPDLNRVYAVTNNGIYFAIKSNFSAGWTQIATFPARYLLANAQDQTLLAASLFNRLLRTTDGQNWVNSDTGIQNYFVGAMGGTIDFDGRDVVIAGTDNGAFRAAETAAGSAQLEPWVHTGLYEPTFGMTVKTEFPYLLFAGTERAGIWRSEDYGLNWQPSSGGVVPVEIFDIAQSETTSATLYLGTSAGLFTSRNNGDSWELGVKDLIVNRVFAVECDPQRPGVAFFSSENGLIYRTTDDGLSFQYAASGLPDEDILDIVVIAFGRVYALTGSGKLYASDDDGEHWSYMNGSITQPIISLDYNPATPWVVYAGTQGGGLYFSDTNGILWSQLTHGIDAPYIFDVTVSPNDPYVVYAAAVGKLYVTVDGGGSWAAIGQGLPANANVTQVALEKDLPQIVYASVRNEGLYKSNDGGTTFQPVGSSLPGGGTMPVSISTVTEGKVFAGTKAKGVYTTLDRGENWVPTNYGMTVFTRAIDFSPQDPSQMFAASLGSGIFRTRDGAQFWENKGLSDRFIFDVEVSSHDPNTVFAGTSRGISRSLDGGETWQTLGQGLDFVQSMAVDPNDPSTIYVGGSGETSRLLVSHNAGASWNEANHELPESAILAITVDPVSGALYCAPQGLGVYKSIDAGASWTQTNPAAFGSNDVTVLRSIPDLGAIVAGTSGKGFLVTLDGGASWFPSNVGLPADASISSIAVDSTDPRRIYLGMFGARVYKSEDAGGSWLPVAAGLPMVSVNRVRIDPFDPAHLWAATSAGIYQTHDRGVTWGEGRLTDHAVLDLIPNPLVAGALIAGLDGVGVNLSTDGGLSWTQPQGTIATLTGRNLGFGEDPTIVYLGTSGAGFLRSDDGGLTWPEPDAFFHPFVTTLESDPQTPSIIYAGAVDKGVIKSTDNGESWQVMSQGLTSFYSLSMVIDAEAPQVIYLGTIDSGVFMSEDSGAHWEQLTDGLYNKVVTSLLIDPVDHNTIYAGTEGGGVFRMKVRASGARDWSVYP